MRAVVVALLALGIGFAHAAPPPDLAAARAAVAAADAAASRAQAAGDQWMPTVTALKEAHAALARGDAAAAVAAARHARHLAVLSLRQAAEQKRLWRNEVPRG